MLVMCPLRAQRCLQSGAGTSPRATMLAESNKDQTIVVIAVSGNGDCVRSSINSDAHLLRIVTLEDICVGYTDSSCSWHPL